jgi:YVTN family beta-propeller protein
MNRSTLFVFLLAACGDNSFQPGSAVTPDAGPADAYVAKPRAVAVAGDFMSPGTGVVSRLDITGLTMGQNLVPLAAQGDPVLRHYDGKIYVINRFGSNNVTILDGKTLQLVDQIGTGANTNPQDVAVVGNKLYVPAMGTSGVVVLTRGSAAIKTIDLSSLDTVGPNDGQPECVSAYAVGTKVYVACGVLDSFFAAEKGKIAVIDSATDTVVATAAMTHPNPVGFFERAPAGSTYGEDLLIPTVPSFTDYASGCIERVSTGGATSVSCGLTNQEMAGYATRLSVAPDESMLYVAVGTWDANFTTPTGKLKGFDLDTGSLWTAPVSSASQLIIDVAACPGGDIVAMDQTFNKAGLRVWRNGVERTTEAMSIGMPPTTNALACYDAP